jgi:hypothetical protein
MAAGLTVKIRGDASHFQKTLTGVKGGISSLAGPIGTLTTGMAAFGAAALGVAAAGVAITKSFIQFGEEARKEDAVLGNVVKSMGLFGSKAGDVTERMIDYADATELATGIDAGIIKSTQQKLATFEDVAKTAGETGGAFDRATKAALDMATVFGGDASSYAIQLGKALQDPEKGLNALKKTGALMSQDVERIGEEFKRTGDKARTFNQILTAVERQVKGSSEASATGTSRIAAAFRQMRDEIGVPISKEFDKFAASIAAQTPLIVAAIQDMGPKIGTAANSIFTALALAASGNTQQLIRIGDFIAEAIGQGLKIGLTRIVFEATESAFKLIEDLNPLRKMFGDQTGKISEYIAANKQSFYQDQMSGAAGKLGEMMIPMETVQGAGGQQFRVAAPGETSALVDDLGRAIILLESINQNVKKPAFASP